tara:strand:+ start:322 stop:1296 length:975 start_codon:yes stop_codon:yes gene_type:complete
MKNKKKEGTEILHPRNQLALYGYSNYFSSLAKLFNKGELPNCILFSGSKGLGKSTFVYHFVNYLLSKNEEKSYQIDKFSINSESKTYNLLNQNIHPNFYLIENHYKSQEIKIEQIRDLISFINKSTYLEDLKVIMIDNAENLNLNSSNALLKVLEEPSKNTFFFIIHNDSFRILDTIKSRCLLLRIFFQNKDKKEIFNNIKNQYNHDFNEDLVNTNLHYDTPGNLLRNLYILQDLNIDLSENRLETISLLLKKYEDYKNYEILPFLFLLIEKFYNDVCLKNNNRFSSYFLSYQKIIKEIHNMKKFNLNEKNSLNFINNILQNEA